jgi:hypothetical protein
MNEYMNEIWPNETAYIHTFIVSEFFLRDIIQSSVLLQSLKNTMPFMALRSAMFKNNVWPNRRSMWLVCSEINSLLNFILKLWTQVSYKMWCCLSCPIILHLHHSTRKLLLWECLQMAQYQWIQCNCCLRLYTKRATWSFVIRSDRFINCPWQINML